MNYFKLMLIVIYCIIIQSDLIAQVGIGTTTPNSNSILDISSTTQGLLTPRLTTIEKNTLGTALGVNDTGLLVFDSTDKAFYYWNGMTWLLIRIDSVITDDDSTGTIYITSEESTNIPVANVPVKISGSTASENLANFTDGGVNNRLVYTGNATKIFSVISSVSFQGDSAQNSLFSFYIAKGSGGSTSVVNSTKVSRFIAANSDVGALSISGNVSLSPGDWVEVWAECEDNNALIVKSLNLLIN